MNGADFVTGAKLVVEVTLLVIGLFEKLVDSGEKAKAQEVWGTLRSWIDFVGEGSATEQELREVADKVRAMVAANRNPSPAELQEVTELFKRRHEAIMAVDLGD